MFGLTSFQRDLLYVITGKSQLSGQDIKDELSDDFGEITHGRLYPNLDTLVEKGYVKKGKIDRRSNYYEITPYGRKQLQARREWENRYVSFTE
ncbi:MAG: PadR family transcriptional regulator [Haloferacaceae archaeon]